MGWADYEGEAMGAPMIGHVNPGGIKREERLQRGERTRLVVRRGGFGKAQSLRDDGEVGLGVIGDGIAERKQVRALDDLVVVRSTDGGEQLAAARPKLFEVRDGRPCGDVV